jgi:sulfofructose kinase
MPAEGDTLLPLVVCLGNLVADHTFWVRDILEPPSKNIARTYRLGPGGMAANAAIAVVRLGGRALFWGRVGDDLNGRTLAEAVADEGVNVSQLRRVPGGRTPVSAVLVDRMGERSTFNFRGEGLALDPDWLSLEALDEARALLCDPRWPEGAVWALSAARERGIPSVLDGEKSETRILRQLVPMVDHAIFSVSGAYGPLPSTVDGGGFSDLAQHHGISSSMRLLGQPLTKRLSRSVK